MVYCWQKESVNLLEGTLCTMSSSRTFEIPSCCTLCPRSCGADRAAGQAGYCGAAGALKVARAALHFWEEPCISGTKGSGTVFFSGCSLRCCYCQNYPISAQAFLACRIASLIYFSSAAFSAKANSARSAIPVLPFLSFSAFLSRDAFYFSSLHQYPRLPPPGFPPFSGAFITLNSSKPNMEASICSFSL